MGFKDELAYVELVKKDVTFGHFINPDTIRSEPDCTDLIQKYRIAAQKRECDYTQHRQLFSNHHPFIDYVEKIVQCPHPNIEQCTPKYYADLIYYLHCQPEIRHICEVGVFLGGGSAYLAQFAVERNLTLDLIDLNIMFLGYTYERILSIIPEAAANIRIFHGDFPAYIDAGHLTKQPKQTVFAQFDASHRFPDVVKDMTCIGKNQAQFYAFAIQDTHLRSKLIEAEVFVDLAVQAVFGSRMSYVEIGTQTGPKAYNFPNSEWMLYTRPNAPEGILLELNRNQPEYFGN